MREQRFAKLKVNGKQRFTRLLGKINSDLAGARKKQFVDIQRFLVFALKGPLSEGAGSAVFFRRDWRSFDLGFCIALDLIFFRLFSGRR